MEAGSSLEAAEIDQSGQAEWKYYVVPVLATYTISHLILCVYDLLPNVSQIFCF
jgi:hypothetical protein